MVLSRRVFYPPLLLSLSTPLPLAAGEIDVLRDAAVLDVLGAASGKRQVRSKATQADNGPVLVQVLIILPSSSPAQACSSGMRHAACGKAMTMSGLLKPIAMRARKESLRVASAKGVEVSDVVGQWTDLTKKYHK